jgi:SNF2 family DNA or RNA helicase
MKIDAVKDIIEGTDESIIIWTRFKAEVEMLRSELLKDYNPAILIGETKNREEELKRFKSGGTRILLGTAETGGYGLTLTEASIMIYYSLTTKGEAIYQSEGRIYRLGTKKPPIYYYLVIGGSIDKFIYNLIMKKKQLLEIDIKKAIEGEE